MTIINRENRIIFLKSHKTASTSTELYLIKYTCLGSDIYSTSKDIKKHGLKTTKRNIVIPSDHNPCFYSNKKALDNAEVIKQHHDGESLRNLIGEGFFDSHFKITNIRNPWDAIVSYYKWKTTGRAGRSDPITIEFKDFLSNIFKKNKKNKYGFSHAQSYLFYNYISGPEWEVDRVLFFEDLARSIDSTLREFKIDHPGFDKVNIDEKRTRKRNDDYRSWYSDETAELVKKHFSSFLSRYPYSFCQPGCLPY